MVLVTCISNIDYVEAGNQPIMQKWSITFFFLFQIMGKYDSEKAAEVMQWIGELLPDSGITGNGDMDYVHEKLGDGYELCR